MKLDYETLKDDSQQISAEIDRQLEEEPDDEEAREMQEFLADRYKALLFLGGEH